MDKKTELEAVVLNQKRQLDFLKAIIRDRLSEQHLDNLLSIFYKLEKSRNKNKEAEEKLDTALKKHEALRKLKEQVKTYKENKHLYTSEERSIIEKFFNNTMLDE